jgi:methylmalonyl-CoA mutase N-terminal domain/subunit
MARSPKKRRTRKDWELETLGPYLATRPERSVEFSTVSSLPFERLASPEDLDAWDPDERLGYPGEYPYTRGIHPTMYRGKLWTMRQFSGFGSASDTNARYKYLLASRPDGSLRRLDLPTLMGHDSDNALAQGEVGREGSRSTRSTT